MRAVLLLCLVAVAIATPNNPHKTPNNPHVARPAGINAKNADPSKCLARSAKGTFRPSGQFQVLSNSVLRLGVHGPGDLNAYPTSYPSANTDGNNPVGLRYLAGGVENDATSPGCYCEGFGVSGVWADATSTTGWANQASGEANIAYTDPVLIDATSADATATIGSGDNSLGVLHEFRISNLTANVFQVRITLTNNHATQSITRLRYERSMDWDIYPTTFAECVDIDLGTSADIPCAHDDGFTGDNVDGDFPGGILFNLGCGSPGRSVYNSGPADHGSAFRIEFADINAATPLAPGASKSFNMFYGAAGTKADARNALNLVGAEAFSLGYPNHSGSCAEDANDGSPNTYLWGFSGVGGEILPGSDPCAGRDCAKTVACPTALSASASTTTAKCASISFDAAAC